MRAAAARVLTARAAATAVALLSACTESRRIEITYGTELPSGFQCTGTDGELLGERAIEDGIARASLVVDFVRLGGVPGCHPAELSQWCADPARDCEAIPELRFCHEMDPILIVPDEQDNEEFQRQITALDGTLIAANAPAEPVVIRMVITAEPCDVVGPFDQDLLIGCLTSCPVQLDALEGEVFLGSPTLGECGLDDVVACATNFVQ
jgi:hypothetical protein